MSDAQVLAIYRLALDVIAKDKNRTADELRAFAADALKQAQQLGKVK